MENVYPIIGKWYKVIHGRYEGFVGECVSFDFNNALPIMLQDLEYNTKAVKPDEIKECLRQPTKPDLQQNQKS